MKQCWPEGDLRAYLDGELPAETQQQITGHLQGCPQCSGRYGELSQRAARIGNLMAMLPAATPAGVVRLAPAPARHQRQWAVAAFALAAGLAIGFVAISRRDSPPVRVAASPVVAATPVAVETAMPVRQAAAPRRTVRHSAVRPAVMNADFMRLDDEPLETGTVMRVSAENGDVLADLIVGPDGRAHAIRVLSNR